MGFHSEQGAESIHARFNSMLRTYSSVRNQLERLGKVVHEHVAVDIVVCACLCVVLSVYFVLTHM